MSEGTEDAFGEWCPDVGMRHEWSAWGFSEVGPHECRFCARCGAMEQQDIWIGDTNA